MKFKTTYLIGLQAVLFIIFLLVTFFFNRFAVDDFHFIGELRNSSFEDIYNHLYNDWHGRWTSNFLLIYFLQYHETSFFLMVYNVLSIGLLYIGIVSLAKSINTYYKLNFQKNKVLIYSGVFLSVFFFCTISPNDTWLWYTSSIVYLWSSISLFFALKILFIERKRFFDYILFGFSLIYVGGSNEPLTSFIAISLLILIFKKIEIKISILGLVLISISFLINYMSPGTIQRDLITPSLGVVDLILYSGYSTIKFALFSIPQTFIPALFLAIPFYLLGKTLSTHIFKKFNPMKDLGMSLLAIILVVYLNHLMVVFALGGLAPDRSGIASSIFIAIIITRYFFLLGNAHQHKFELMKYIIVLNVIGLMVFNVYFFNIHRNYAKAVDERIDFIMTHDKTTIHVRPLPYSGYIYSAEITDNNGDFKNQHLKNGLGIKNDIVLTTDR